MPKQKTHLFGAVALGAVAMQTVPALAGSSSGCSSANSGAVNAEIAPLATVSRTLALDAGDRLSITARSGASVAFVSAAGVAQILIAETAAGATSFKAPIASNYVFVFAASARATASVSVSCTSAQTAAASGAFLQRRRDALAAQEPARIRVDPAPPIASSDKPLANNVALDAEGNPREVEFSVSLSEIQAAAHPGRKPDPGLVDLWVEGRMQNYEATAAELGVGSGNLGVLYVGTRTMLGPDILVGGLAQLDRGVESDQLADGQMAATGWMAGPYLSMKLGSGVTFDGRAAWGTTENAIVSDTNEASDATGRRLVRAKLTGARDVGGWRVAPSLGLVYLEDAVRDGASGETRAAGAGRVELVPELSRRFQINGDTFVEPRAGVGGFVGFDHLQTLAPTLALQDADLHMKAEAGLAVGIKDGSSLEASGGVESGSAELPETWSGRVQLKVPLSK